MNNLQISPHALVTAGIAVLICWRLYARFRRLVGRQTVGRARRLTFNVILFPLLLVVLGLSAMRSASLCEGLVAGAAIGVALGFVGLKLTRFEVSDTGFHYTPNTVLGIGVMLLFVGRLAYRFGTLFLGTGKFDPAAMQSIGSSPLTLAIFGVVAAYYTTFAAGVLLWFRRARGQGSQSPIAGTPVG